MIKKIIDMAISFLFKMIIAGVIFLTLFLICIITTNIIIVQSTKNRILTYDQINDNDYDCILVLGAGVKDGQPTWMLEDRILVGIDVYNLTGNKLLMSGDHSKVDYNEVGTMKDYAMTNGNVPSEDIYMDHAGVSTYESMYRAKNIFGAKKVIIISQGYHLYRSIYNAKKLGIDAYGVSADLRNYRKMPYYKFRESLARTKDFFKLIFKPEPTYLGETISLDGSGDITND